MGSGSVMTKSSGKVLVTPGGKIATSSACCCNPCPLVPPGMPTSVLLSGTMTTVNGTICGGTLTAPFSVVMTVTSNADFSGSFKFSLCLGAGFFAINLSRITHPTDPLRCGWYLIASPDVGPNSEVFHQGNNVLGAYPDMRIDSGGGGPGAYYFTYTGLTIT